MKENIKIIYFKPKSELARVTVYILILIISLSPFGILLLLNNYKILPEIFLVISGIILSPILWRLAKILLIPLFGNKHEIIFTKENIQINSEKQNLLLPIDDNLFITPLLEYEFGNRDHIQINYKMKVVILISSYWISTDSNKNFQFLIKKYRK